MGYRFGQDSGISHVGRIGPTRSRRTGSAADRARERAHAAGVHQDRAGVFHRRHSRRVVAGAAWLSSTGCGVIGDGCRVLRGRDLAILHDQSGDRPKTRLDARILGSPARATGRAALASTGLEDKIMHRPVTTFEKHIEILAIESPCALILEWGRRLELALKNYRKVLGLEDNPWKDFADVLQADRLVGPEVSAQIIDLRNRRNEVAHETPKCIPADDAIQYTRKAEDIVWLLGRAEDIKESRVF